MPAQLIITFREGLSLQTADSFSEHLEHLYGGVAGTLHGATVTLHPEEFDELGPTWQRSEDCEDCAREEPFGACSKSEKTCGHHCECSWVHDVCHWCGARFGEGGLIDFGGTSLAWATSVYDLYDGV